MALPRSMHISQLKQGDQLRIALKAGHGVEPGHNGVYQTPPKRRSARGFTRMTFYAFMQANDPVNGQMTVSLQETNPAIQPSSYTAVINYSDILVLQQIVPQGRPVVETAPKTHPGAQALGTKMSQLFPQPYLIPVTFVGR